MAAENSTLSIRVPRMVRTLVASASKKTGLGIAEYYLAASNDAAVGVMELDKNLKLVPKWVPIDERDRQMVSMMIPTKDLVNAKVAAKRLMIPHTRFVVWAVTLVAVSDLGRKQATEVAERVAKELNGASPAS